MNVSFDGTFAADRNLANLLKKASRGYLSKEDLANEELPLHLTFAQTWRLLTDIRRSGGISVPFQEKEGFSSWYSPTLHITQTLAQLERTCSEHSPLTKKVRDAKASDIYAESLADEIIGMALHDNVSLDRARTLDFLIMRYTPRNNAEQLLRNVYSLTESLDEFRSEPLGVELVDEIYRRMMAGVDESQLDLPPQARQIADLSRKIESTASPHESLENVLAYADGTIGDPYDRPLIRAFFLRTYFSFYHPLPSMNSTVGRFLFALTCLRNDLPLACMVPYSSKLFAWLDKTRLVNPYPADDYVSTLAGSLPCALDNQSASSDFTAWAALALDLLSEAVSELEQRIEQQERNNSILESMLSDTFMVNRRQRAVLSNALRNPHATFMIRQHRIDYQVAYGTARSDLVELADAGFLEQRKEGKTFVFRPHPLLKEKLNDYSRVLTNQ